jgi:hypothetical protein
MNNLEPSNLYKCLKNFLIVTDQKGIPITTHDNEDKRLWHTTYNFKGQTILTIEEIDLNFLFGGRGAGITGAISWQIIHDEKIMFITLSKHELNFFVKLNEK